MLQCHLPSFLVLLVTIRSAVIFAISRSASSDHMCVAYLAFWILVLLCVVQFSISVMVASALMCKTSAPRCPYELPSTMCVTHAQSAYLSAWARTSHITLHSSHLTPDASHLNTASTPQISSQPGETPASQERIQ